jgi:heme-degrading monooxygenase HmoA
MIAIVWEFVASQDSISDFRRVYGPNGDWAVLFRRFPGYEGTTLLQDEARPTRFLTVDRWTDAAAFRRMKEESQPEYARLDEECRTLTSSERELGVFEEV